MSIDLNKIQEKLDMLISDISERDRVLYDMYYDTNPKDVSFQKYDANGKLQTIKLPNLAKIKSSIGISADGSIIGAKPIMGNWYPSAHGGNASTPPGKQFYVTFDKEFDVTNKSYFTNLGGNSGIRIEKKGYYHIECRLLVYVSPGDYGYAYLYLGGRNIDLDHSHNPNAVSWDDRHMSWKGNVNAKTVVKACVYHHKASNYPYHSGPIYTWLTIHKIN